LLGWSNIGDMEFGIKTLPITRFETTTNREAV
jgi:hypothetical protein